MCASAPTAAAHFLTSAKNASSIAAHIRTISMMSVVSNFGLGLWGAQ